MAHVLDRWTIAGPPDARGRPTRTKGPRHGVGKRWAAVWTEPDGTRRKKACTTKEEAEAHLAHVLVQQQAGTYITAARAQITIRAMAERWYDEQVHQRATSLETIRRRLDNTILPTLGHYQVGDVTRTQVQAAITAWSKDLAPSTVRVAYVYVAAIFNLAVDERRIPSTPCRRINLPRNTDAPAEPMTVQQVQTLVDSLWTPYRRMAVFVAATGVRPGEARGLTWDRITYTQDGGQAKIDRQLVKAVAGRPVFGPLKTPSSLRTVSFGPETAHALGDPGEGLVFVNHLGRPITRQNASEAWRHAAPGVGLEEGTGWHELRHFHASLLIARGASPVAVAHRLGHKDPTETLRTYAHLWPDDDTRMRDATDGIVVLSERPDNTHGSVPAGQGPV